MWKTPSRMGRAQYIKIFAGQNLREIKNYWAYLEKETSKKTINMCKYLKCCSVLNLVDG